MTASGAAAPAPRPNLILILADDLGQAEIGAYGQREIATPALDGMAMEGLRFTQFYTGTPVCAPSRCNLMTGMHNGHSRVRDNDVDYLRAQDITLAEVLKFAGYRTGLFGKWGLSFNDKPESFPTRQGFDRFFGYLDQRHAHNFYPTFLIDNEDTLRLKNVVPNQGAYGQGNATVEAEYSHDLIVDRALQFIEASKDTSFFLYLAPTLPHINNEGAAGADGGFEVPELGPYAAKDWPLPKKSYAAMISRLDRDVGRVLARLKALGIDGRTCVVFLSDNGPTYLQSADDGKTKVVGEWFDGNGALRGFKSDVYEGGIRMPALIRWPGTVPSASISLTPGYFPDIMPTFADLAGVTAPTNIDGISLVPTWIGRPGQKARDHLYWFYPNKAQRAVRRGPWKAIWRDGAQALYNLDQDPGETRDVRAENPTVAAQLDSIHAREGTGVPVVGNWTPALKVPVALRPRPDAVPAGDLAPGAPVALMDLSGRRLRESVRADVSLEGLRRGIYFLQALGPDGRAQGRPIPFAKPE